MSKIKTIKRRKSWPKWARWYAMDENKECFIYTARPISLEYQNEIMWASDGRGPMRNFEQVQNVLRGPNRHDCGTSLRRITD